MDSEPVQIQVGVLLPPSGPLGYEERADFDDDGYANASGGRDAARGRQVALRGTAVLRAAAEAVGHEIGHVVDGVIAGIQENGSMALDGNSFAIQDIELKFGTRITFGAGKVVEALFTASGEATVEVTLTLRHPGVEPIP